MSELASRFNVDVQYNGAEVATIVVHGKAVEQDETNENAVIVDGSVMVDFGVPVLRTYALI